MSVFAGILCYESMCVGARGWVAVCSNLLPRLSARLYECTAVERDLDAGRAVYREILTILRSVGGHGYGLESKPALAMMCLPAGERRATRLPLPAADRELLRADLAALG